MKKYVITTGAAVITVWLVAYLVISIVRQSATRCWYSVHTTEQTLTVSVHQTGIGHSGIISIALPASDGIQGKRFEHCEGFADPARNSSGFLEIVYVVGQRVEQVRWNGIELKERSTVQGTH